MQCVEKGLFELDAPITKILTEFEHADILNGFDDAGKPIRRRPTKEITLRHLLTHTSGLGYIGMNQNLTRFAAEAFSEPASFGLNSPKYSCQVPLVAEPGEKWEYGVGLEWAGKMVERVSGKSLGEYMRENIFGVLGMDFTTFHPWDQPEIMVRMGGRTWRDHATGKVTIDQSGWFPESERPEEDYGGGGAYSCTRDYLKVLMSLLVNDGKLLKPETVDKCFMPQVEDPTSLQEQLTTGPISIGATNGLPKEDCKFNYGLGGALCTNSIPGHCGRGMMFWSGLPNSFWVSISVLFCLHSLTYLCSPIHSSSIEKQAAVECTSRTFSRQEMVRHKHSMPNFNASYIRRRFPPARFRYLRRDGGNHIYTIPGRELKLWILSIYPLYCMLCRAMSQIIPFFQEANQNRNRKKGGSEEGRTSPVCLPSLLQFPTAAYQSFQSALI